MVEILLENDACRHEYAINRCLPDTRVPAMNEKCNEWEKCMHRDPEAIARCVLFAIFIKEQFKDFRVGGGGNCGIVCGESELQEHGIL
jgi:hypothetical protein